jgi:Right handed beta helix region
MKYLKLKILIYFISMFYIATYAQETRTVKIGNTIYGATADERGPIGGGVGYKCLVTRGNYLVNDLEGLISALENAKNGDTIFIPGDTEIDLTTLVYISELVLEIAEGVTLAGERGNNGFKGALLTSDALKTSEMIRAMGPNIRITGIRMQGPCSKRYLDHHKRAFGPDGKGSSYYYQFPISRGISTEYHGLEVDNCEISGFAHAGIYLKNGDNQNIHHNSIHNCQYNGLGYGITHNTASSLIEYNCFNWNRHSIAGTGRPGCSYIARNNLESGESLSHCFDMHGGRDRKDSTEIAGTTIEIYNNTFNTSQYAVVIRGIPSDHCEIYQNWFKNHLNPDEAVRAKSKTAITDNAYGSELKIVP